LAPELSIGVNHVCTCIITEKTGLEPATPD